MQKSVVFLLLQMMTFCGWAQVAESFEDGDFTTNPAWTTATSNDWLVNSDKQLQSNSSTVNSSFFIATPSTMATSAQWEFWVRLAFNPSSANYIDVYLTASASTLSLSNTTGYFVRIGNTQDEVSLYRKDANGTATKLIDGVDGITDKSDNVLRTKVIRNSANQFTLLRDAGSGNNFVSEGTAIDGTYTTSAFFGFLVKQSTASFFQRHFFDDIEIRTYVPDNTPPSVVAATALSPTTADVLFSEPVDLTSSQTAANYVVTNGIGAPLSAVRSAINPALVQLTFASAFGNGSNYTLTVNGVTDLSANTAQNATAVFSFYTPQPYDVVIDEIMADPAPPVLLPNTEFIELKNISGRAINLQGWRLSTSSAVSGAFPAYNLPADSFLIITSTTAATSLAPYGRVLGVSSFPSLPNDGGVLQLLSREGRTIHTVNYALDWYQNPAKADGGWTLEMIDTRNPCSGTGNWRSSTDATGGTPGKKNSVDGNNSDTSPPQLLRTYNTDSATIIAVFNEPLDSVSASLLSHYSITNLTITGASVQPPLFNRVLIRLAAAMQKETVYTLTVSGITDCKGNTISGYNKARAGWAEEATAGDLVINEVLFNPRPNAFDYVEFYNRSKKVLDASRLFVANHNSTGTVASQRKLAEEPFLIFPEDYLVVTQNKASLQQQYLVKNEEALLILSSLPLYPDDKGTVVVLSGSSDIIDEVSYDKGWHFALINDAEGVALERIDPNNTSQDVNNWHSAASTAGYGTPTYKNSQYKTSEEVKAIVEVSPPVFSPDNDGRDDVATISYKVEERGFVANILLFDAGGRLVRQLVRNELLSLSGTWKWDGLGDKQNKLPVGTYIVFMEIFNTEGKRKIFKNTVVLGRQLN
jgi:hypothetical protein